MCVFVLYMCVLCLWCICVFVLCMCVCLCVCLCMCVVYVCVCVVYVCIVCIVCMWCMPMSAHVYVPVCYTCVVPAREYVGLGAHVCAYRDQRRTMGLFLLLFDFLA